MGERETRETEEEPLRERKRHREKVVGRQAMSDTEQMMHGESNGVVRKLDRCFAYLQCLQSHKMPIA